MADGSLLLRFTPAIDLTAHTNGDLSPDEDFITFFAKGPFSSTAVYDIQFYTSFSGLARAWFHAQVSSQQQPTSTLGMASVLEVQNSVGDILNRDRFAGRTEQDELNLQIAAKTWIVPLNAWQYFTIPKRAFTAEVDFRWNSITACRFNYRNTAVGVYCVSDVFLVGGGIDNGGTAPDADGTSDMASGGGMQGTYKYRLTYFNENTGNRSNPSVATQVAKDVNRGGVILSNIPASLDPQVTHVEIWRTVGNGDEFFFIARIPNGQTEFTDEVADHDTVDSTSGVAVMSTDKLPLDNDRPEDTFDDCIIHQLSAFWLSNDVGKTGRVYYSPIGRPESLEGFINVTPAGDPLHRLVVHAGQRLAFSESTLYRIAGDNPYVSQKVAGVPGVRFAQRRTVVSTPFGVVWQAPDGIRVTNGGESTLLNFDAIGRIFRGEAREGIPAFEGTTATFARGEYLISNGTRTLGIDLAAFAWRNVGFNDVSALDYEWDTDTIVGGRATNTQLLEVEGVFTDAASAIPVEWETPALAFPNDQILYVDRIFIDVDPGGNTLTPAIVHRFGADSLTSFSAGARVAREFAVGQLLLKPSVRLSGNATSRIELYDIEIDATPLMLGVNVSGRSERNALAELHTTYPGRYREGTGNGEIVFEIPRQTKEYDMTDRTFVIDRLTIEAHTAGTNVTASLGLVGGDITFATLNTSARRITSYEIDRLGNPTEVRLAGDFFTAGTRPTIYRVELHLREIELGIRVSQIDAPRISFPARAPRPDVELVFEIPPNRRELDDTGTLYVLDRLVVEADTQGGGFVPVIDVQAGASVTLTAISTSSRSYVSRQIDRIGTIRGLRLLGDYTGDRRFYGVELYIRPLMLGVNLTTRGTRAEIPGRTLSPSTEIIYEMQPLHQELNMQGSLFWIERIVVEANTNGSTITVLIDTDGVTIVAGTVSSTSRGYVELVVERPCPIRALRLQDNFTDNVQLFGIEMHVRPVELGISRFGGSRITHDGKMINPSSRLVFDVDPARAELDSITDIPLIQFLNIEANTGGTDLVPVIETELGNITLTAVNTSVRETAVYEIQEVGNVLNVRLDGDFTGAVALYGVEAVIGQLSCGLRVCEVR